MTEESNKKRRSSRVWLWLLVIPLIATLYPPFYSFVKPTFYGIPFFYWYQFLWVIIAAVITGIVYYATREKA